MNKKVYKTLEYNKILTMLSSYAACDETKKRCLSLEPITDLYEIRHLQTTTADALSRLYKDSICVSGTQSQAKKCISQHLCLKICYSDKYR